MACTLLASHGAWIQVARQATFALLIGAALQVTLPRDARANGNNTHTWISLRAAEHLPPGALRDLLTDPEHQQILLNGSMFPDGGYVIGDDYGEMAHWEPFHEAYRAWIVRNFDKPYYQGEAARHVAFLFGVVSHGMADQVFDSQFMEIAKVYDAGGWSDELLLGFDTATDVMLVADTRQNLMFEPWVPADTISQIYADDLNYVIGSDTLYSTQDLLLRLVLTYPRETGLYDPERVQEFRDQYPWASSNLMDEFVQGSPPCEAVAVAAFWQSMWFRLHEETGPDLVVATVPGDGGTGQPLDSSTVESQLIVVFGEGMEASTVSADTVSVTANGVEREMRFRFHYGDGTNVLRLSPMDDWDPDTEYTVTLKPGIETKSGRSFTEPFAFQFSTAAPDADGIRPCTDPTPFVAQPDVGEPVEEPPRGSDSGCAIGRNHPAGGGLLGLAILVALRPGRRRMRRTG